MISTKVLHAALLLLEMRRDEIIRQSMDLFRQFDTLEVSDRLLIELVSRPTEPQL